MSTQSHFCQTLLVAGLSFIVLSSFSIAGNWTDDFNDGDLKGWTYPAGVIQDEHWRSPWEIRDGVLHVTMDTPVAGKPWTFHPMELLQFDVFAFSASELTVEITVVKTDDIGIALGLPSELPLEMGRFRIFRPYDSSTMAIFADGGFNLLGEDRTGDQVIYSRPRRQRMERMKITFEAGAFRVYSQDGQVAEFVDEGYPSVELVGLFAWGISLGARDPQGLRGALDDFVISGPDIPNWSVAAPGKLATTWGGMKHEHGNAR